MIGLSSKVRRRAGFRPFQSLFDEVGVFFKDAPAPEKHEERGCRFRKSFRRTLVVNDLQFYAGFATNSLRLAFPRTGVIPGESACIKIKPHICLLAHAKQACSFETKPELLTYPPNQSIREIETPELRV